MDLKTHSDELKTLAYTVFTGNTELIYLGQQQIVSSVGSLLENLLNFYPDISNGLSHKLKDFEVSLARRDPIESLAKMLSDFPDSIDDNTSDAVKLLFRLIFILPAYYLYQATLHTVAQVNLSKTETAYFRSRIPDLDLPNGEPDIQALQQRNLDFMNRNAPVQTALIESEKFYQLCMVLDGKHLISDPLPSICIKHDSLGKYLESLKNELIELRKIREELVEQIDSGITDLSLDSRPEATFVFPPYPFSIPARANAVYSTSSLSTLVALDIRRIEQTCHHIKKCDLCGRYFISKRRDARYCTSPNSLFSGRACNRVGAQLQFANREGTTLLGSQYRKRYNSYRKWLSQQRKQQFPLLKPIILSLADGTPEQKQAFADNELRLIEKEMESLFQVWNEAAKKAVSECTPATIAEHSALLDLPPVQERSPKLAEWLDEVAKSNGR